MNIVITGGTKGIGNAIAERFAAEGYNVLICARSESDLQESKLKLLQINDAIKVHTLKVDLSIKQDVQQLIQFIGKCFVKVDVLVNNAGLFENSEMLLEQDNVFERTMSTNVSSMYYICKEIGNSMKKGKSGYIFNLGSIAGKEVFVNCGAYCISKYAVHGLTKVLREELKNFGVKVSLVVPGATYTSSWEGSDLPPQRFVAASDVAEMIFSATKLSAGALAEEIHIQPLLGKI